MLPATTAEATRRFADRIAYVSEAGWPLTYADLDRISDEAAAGLALRGVGLGSVVALILPPGPEYLLSYLAAAKLGAITAGVNDRLSAREREAVLERAAPALVLAAPGFGPEQYNTVEIPNAAGGAAVLEAIPGARRPPPPPPRDPHRPPPPPLTS